MRVEMKRCGAKCDVCGVEHHAPSMAVVNLKFFAHDVWARFSGWHRRLGALWDESYSIGMVHALPWRADRRAA